MNQSKKKLGEDELNRTFYTTIKLLGNLSTFYSVMLKGLSYGTAQQMSEMELTCDELYEEGTLASWLIKPEMVDDFYKIMKDRMQKVHQEVKSGTKKALDATAIVFAHGVLDVSVYGYLEVLSLAIPDSFKIYTERKQVCLLEVESKSYEQLHIQKVKEFMENVVEKNSLIYKLDKFHEITKPTSTRMNPDYNYERDKIVEFDEARHNIVHGNDWSGYNIDFTNELFYWNLLHFYLTNLVVKTTGLKLSQEGGNKYWLGV